MQRLPFMRLIVLAIAATWTISAVAPANLRICIQSSGLIQAGLTCPCTECERRTTPDTGQCTAAECCATETAEMAIRQHCCTCIELPALVSLAGTRSAGPDNPPVATITSSPPHQLNLLRSAPDVAWNAQASPPPLLKRCAVLRL